MINTQSRDTSENSQKLVDFSQKNLPMDKKLANAQKTCKFTKKYADINVGIVAPSKNLQMHKILAKRQIRRYLTKYLRMHYQIIHPANTANHGA
jgi:hypothetical protein